MSSYYARITIGMGGEKLVAITGMAGRGLYRAVEVDIAGNPVGAPFYTPANLHMAELELINGRLQEAIQSNEEINWEEHESNTGKNYGGEEALEEDTTTSVSSLSHRNPILAAFPDLQ